MSHLADLAPPLSLDFDYLLRRRYHRGRHRRSRKINWLPCIRHQPANHRQSFFLPIART
jgi:hypothetical protein